MKKNHDNKLAAAAFSIMLSGLMSILAVVMTWDHAGIRLYPILTAVCIWFAIFAAISAGKEE